MSEIDAVQGLLDANYKELIIAFAVLIVAIVVIKKFYNEFIEIFNIETPGAKKEREQKEEFAEFKKQLEELKEKQHELQKQSNEADQKMEAQVASISELLKALIVTSMRTELWRIHGEYTEKGYITQEGLKTFIECGKLYESAGGNDIYHTKLHPEIMSLPIQ